MFPRSELSIIDDDPVVLDGPPEWLVPGLRSAMRETEHDGLGLRSLIERADVTRRPWPTVRDGRLGRRRIPARAKAGRQPVRRGV